LNDIETRKSGEEIHGSADEQERREGKNQIFGHSVLFVNS
jgi:hypothetical protein